jgi:hypothetical protein
VTTFREFPVRIYGRGWDWLAQEFAHMYHDRFHFKDFVNRIDHLAKMSASLSHLNS